MSNIAIQVENLSKLYKIGARQQGYKTLRESIMGAFTAPLRRFKRIAWSDVSGQISVAGQSSNDHIWALKDVSFEVNQGEVVGIIGRNGAGKTTLLKILSRITEPTKGRATIHGRVGSLLEVGTGFHQELTGRENIYLNGAILGMRKVEIERKFDEIVSFAEIEKFMDTPVKRYSSGMYVRLAFAVAAHLEPEILLVDEVLAVGDASFQKKCLGKMEDVAKEGRTVIFVSHNMAAVENLCQHGIVLDDGHVKFIGSQTSAIGEYLISDSARPVLLRDRKDRLGSGELRVVSMEIRDEEDNVLDVVRTGQSFYIRLYFETKPDVRLSRCLAGISVKTPWDTPVFLHHSRMSKNDFGTLNGKGFFVCSIKRLPLPAAVYKMGFSIMPNYGRDGGYFDSVADAMSLTVVEGDFYGSGEIPPVSHGVLLVDASWKVRVG